MWGPRGQEGPGARVLCPCLGDRSCPPPQLYLVCSHSGSLSLQGQGEGVTRRGKEGQIWGSPPTLQSKSAPPPPRDSLSTLVTGGARTEPGEQAGGQEGAVWVVCVCVGGVGRPPCPLPQGCVHLFPPCSLEHLWDPPPFLEILSSSPRSLSVPLQQLRHIRSPEGTLSPAHKMPPTPLPTLQPPLLPSCPTSRPLTLLLPAISFPVLL